MTNQRVKRCWALYVISRFQLKTTIEVDQDGRDTTKHLLCVCVCVSRSFMSDSLWPTRLFCPWDSLGKNTGVVAIPFSRGSSRVAKIKHKQQQQNPDNSKYWKECGGTETLTHCWWDPKMRMVIKWYSYFKRQFARFLQANAKHNFTM